MPSPVGSMIINNANLLTLFVVMENVMMHKLEEWLMEHFIEFIVILSLACIALVGYGWVMS